jgi:hypothetical protein
MHQTQIDTSPLTLGIALPADGSKISTLLTSLGDQAYRYIRVDGRLPAANTNRPALLFTSPRPGETLDAADWTDHAKYIPAGEDFELPFDRTEDCYLKPVSGACTILLIVG